MNKLKKCFVLCFLCLLFNSQFSLAQFKLGLGVTGGFPAGSFSESANFGFGVYVEPKYQITERFAIGLNLSVIHFDGGQTNTPVVTNGNFDFVDVSSYTFVPLTIFGDYYFSTSRIKPYIGLGAGGYLITGGDLLNVGSFDRKWERGSGVTFGFAPRIGLEVGKFNFNTTYNILEDGSYVSFGAGVNLNFLKKKK